MFNVYTKMVLPGINTGQYLFFVRLFQMFQLIYGTCFVALKGRFLKNETHQKSAPKTETEFSAHVQRGRRGKVWDALKGIPFRAQLFRDILVINFIYKSS